MVDGWWWVSWCFFLVGFEVDVFGLDGLGRMGFSRPDCLGHVLVSKVLFLVCTLKMESWEEEFFKKW